MVGLQPILRWDFLHILRPVVSKTFSITKLKKSYHQNALIKADEFSSQRVNFRILKEIDQVILFCGREYVALRGNKEKIVQKGNQGNFISTFYFNAE